MKQLAFHPAKFVTSTACFLAAVASVAFGQAPTPTPGKAAQMSIPSAPLRINPTNPEVPVPKATNGHIWSAVLLASNPSKPKDPPEELRALAPRLQRVFGYNQFEIAGKDEATIEDGAERKLTPSRAFWIDLKARHASVKEARGGYLLNLRLYQDEKPIVDTVALIAPESPLFFRGPMHARGQIIVVLQVRP
ncbi:MAG TPA: hypothetical protein VFG14_19910 [Chthoniobacteraceae bacterium]|nr:hypothetical protein [Chthoniobacteraceae bacterium]